PGAKRSPVRAGTPGGAGAPRALSEQLGVGLEIRPWSKQVPESDLVVSSVVSGAANGIARSVARGAPVVGDIIYDPWPTVLAVAAKHAGCRVVSGLDLLVGQALLQIELMTGRSVASEVLYAALGSERADRQHVEDC